MKLFKRAATLVAAAAVAVCCALTAYADSPPGAGTPAGADLITPGMTTGQSTTDPSSNIPSAPTNSSRPAAGASDKSYQPVTSYRGWEVWDGKSELLENTNYYIQRTTSIDGEFTLPSSSTLLADEETKLLIISGSKLTVNGTLTVAPTSELLCSGTFSIAQEGLLENFGNAKFTLNAIVNISSVFASYGDSQTAFAGKTYVYSNGKFTGYGSVFLPQNSETTVTGDWLAAKSGMLYIDGKFITTLSGTLDIKGYTSVQEHARITNSGRMIIESTAKYYVDQNAVISNTQSGRILDHDDPVYNGSNDNTANDFKQGIKGIDVSVWQGVIDWQSVKDAGVQFAIIRSSSGSRVDKMFDYNITEAKKAGILVGVYHYCYALTPEEAREEAQHFINTISPYRIDYPVMFDFEDNSQVKLGKEMLTKIADAFLSELRRYGYYPMIYSYRNWLQNLLDMDKLSTYDVAVAEWNVAAPNYDRPYGIWQYSCKGQISGIEGDVDLDICYKDYTKIINEGGYNRYITK